MQKPVLLLLVPLLAIAGTITRTISFDPGDVRIDQVNGYDVVRLADHITTLEVGEPMMPEAVHNVAVPANATVTKIRVTPLDPVVLPGTYRVHPAQPPVILSASEPPPFVEPDATVYASTSAYPAELVKWAPTGTKSGWRICGFGLRPLSYVPATGQLTLYRRMAVEVDYEPTDATPVRLTAGQHQVFAPDVRGLVVNPEDVERFSPPRRVADDPDIDYVIITSSTLATGWDRFIEWRTRKGYRTEIITTEHISGAYPGRDLPEKIRNCIIDLFETRGLKFVLLAGDNSVVPGRRCRAVVNSETGNIPADVYYADLQWSYDSNNNNIFGEIIVDTTDLFYDVYVGRASVDNSTQVQTFINKVLAYEKNPTTDYLQKMLLPWVVLWNSPYYTGQTVSDTIAAQTPVGWVDNSFSASTPSQLRGYIDEGYHFGHGAAHGDATGLYTGSGAPIYTTSTANSQTNSSRPIIMNSMACISGNFEYSDCLAEVMCNNPNGGAVATMMNSRYGWGTPPSMGPSEKLSVKFFDFFFRFDSVEIGVTHARAKDFYVYSAQGQGVWRWCYWDLNLFGDPNMPMWKGTPGTLTVEYPDTLETGAQTLDFRVTSGGNPVQNALVCVWKPNEVHEAGFTDANGNVSLTFFPITTGTMQFTVTAKQAYAIEDSIVIIPGTPQPYLTYQGCVVDSGGNGRLDPGETAELLATVKNIGNAPATGVVGILRSASPHVTIPDSTADYGTLAGGDSAAGDGFVVTAASMTPPGTRISFTLLLTSSEGRWERGFNLVVGDAPLPGTVTLDHDSGYCRLTVTALGSIGYTEPPSLDLGRGFSYPKAAASQLYYSSLMFGTSPDYLVDRFYGNPASAGPNTDFRILDSLRPVVPPGSGDQHYRCAFSDAGHPAPVGLNVVQHSHVSADPGYDDFVVLAYDITNSGSSTVDGLYIGVIADFDLGSDPTTNTAASDETRRTCLMRQASSADPCVGLKILDPPSFANLTAVDHARYVYPDSAMTDGMKFRVLDGTISLRNSNRNYDWSVTTSVGPFNLPPATTQRVAFALLGGRSEAEFAAHADSAQSWYEDNSALFEPEAGPAPETRRLVCLPNPFARSVRISYVLPVPGRARLQVFDIAGRHVTTLVDDELPSGRLEADWHPEALANGVYLLKLQTPSDSRTEKLLLAR